MTLTAEMWKGGVAPIVLIASDPRRAIARVYEQRDADELTVRYNSQPNLLAACAASLAELTERIAVRRQADAVIGIDTEEDDTTVELRRQLADAIADAEKVEGDV